MTEDEVSFGYIPRIALPLSQDLPPEARRDGVYLARPERGYLPKNQEGTCDAATIPSITLKNGPRIAPAFTTLVPPGEFREAICTLPSSLTGG